MSLHRTAVALAPVALCVLLLAGRAAAQSPEAKAQAAAIAAEQAEEERVRVNTEVYDIRDLLMQKREYPAKSALVPPTRIGERYPGGAGAPARPTTMPASANTAESPQRREDLVEQILTLIKETVDPDSWRDNGGTVGAIRELQGQMIVTQNKANHAALAGLLKQLRERSARMVTVRANWVMLSPDDLRAVAKPLAADPSLLRVDRAAMEKLKDLQQFQGQVTCFNAQTVHVASGRARTVVTEQTPVVGTEAAAYEPGASVVQAGLLLEVTPVLTPDGTTVMLDVQSVASEWESNARSGAAATRPAGMPPEIDRVELMVQQLRTSVALPTGQPVVIGGLSYDLDTPGGADKRSQLYLVIEVVGSRGESSAGQVLPGDNKAIEN